MRNPSPSLAEHACLVLVVQGATHGWVIGSALQPDGELGRVFTLSRPLTYRAIDGLVDKKWVTRKETAGPGRDRAELRPTAAGRRVAQAWLDTPVGHVRDVRVELMLKLLLRERGGQSNAPLLTAQLDAIPFERLTEQLGGDVVDLWRREQARSVQSFLRSALAASEGRRETRSR